MTDRPDDKKPRITPSTTKSYDLDGTTAEFDPGAFQVHAISPELRRKMLEGKLPSRDPQFYQDTLPPNLGLTAPPSEEPRESPPHWDGANSSDPRELPSVAAIPKSPADAPTVPALRRPRVPRAQFERRRVVALAAMVIGAVAVLLAILVLGGRRDAIQPTLSAAKPAEVQQPEPTRVGGVSRVPAPVAPSSAPAVRAPSPTAKAVIAPVPSADRATVPAPPVLTPKRRVQPTTEPDRIPIPAPEPRPARSATPAPTPSAAPVHVSPSPTSIFDTPLKPLTGRTAE